MQTWKREEGDGEKEYDEEEKSERVVARLQAGDDEGNREKRREKKRLWLKSSSSQGRGKRRANSRS